jgi:hypothetical protein
MPTYRRHFDVVYPLNVQLNPPLTVRMCRITDISARLSFVDARGNPLPWPRDVVLASVPSGQLHMPTGDVAVIFSLESYVLVCNGRAVLEITNPREHVVRVV